MQFHLQNDSSGLWNRKTVSQQHNAERFERIRPLLEPVRKRIKPRILDLSATDTERHPCSKAIRVRIGPAAG